MLQLTTGALKLIASERDPSTWPRPSTHLRKNIYKDSHEKGGEKEKERKQQEEKRKVQISTLDNASLTVFNRRIRSTERPRRHRSKWFEYAMSNLTSSGVFVT